MNERALNESVAPARTQTYILNPIAGRRGRRQQRLIVDRLRRAAPAAELIETGARGEAEALALARRDDPDRVIVAVGGDGTVHEVGSALIGAAAAFGVLPVGSGNDFASMIDAPVDMKSAAAFFARRSVRPCDAGQVEWTDERGQTGRAAFINSLGLGIEGAIAARAESLSRVPGFFRYMLAVMMVLPGYRSPSMRLEQDGVRVDARQLLLSVGNGRRAGGGFLLHPQACIDDGWLDVCRADDLPLHRVLRILPSVFSGGHARFDGIHAGRCRRLRLSSDPPTPLHADGELLTPAAVELSLRILPAALRLVG